jgi:uncharacterized ferredoxin-like protein
MIKKSYSAEKETLAHVSSLMLAAARTAPKARGMDNLVTIIITDKDLRRLIKKMLELYKKTDRPAFLRNAESLRQCEVAVLLGSKLKPIGLDCGMCGFKNCQACLAMNARCIYNSLDLGIAIGSAVSLASKFHIDNRIMYTMGLAALALGIMGKDVKIAMGIPLSISGKNIFFDIKK